MNAIELHNFWCGCELEYIFNKCNKCIGLFLAVPFQRSLFKCFIPKCTYICKCNLEYFDNPHIQDILYLGDSLDKGSIK